MNTPPNRPVIHHGPALIFLLLFGYVLLVFGSGWVPLTHPDEVFYAQTVKEMLARGSWLTPYIFDQPQFEKPFLFFAFMAGVARVFGLSAMTARFWPGVFGLLGILLTYCLAWLLFASRRVAFLSGFVLASSFIYIALGRSALTDMMFSVLVVAAIASFVLAHHRPRHRNLGILLFFIFSGLAVLTKGLLGIFFPVGTVLLFLALQRDWTILRTGAPWLWLGGAVFLLITVPWHALMLSRYGQTFLDEYFRNVHLRRLWDAEHAKCDTWYFYLLTVFAGTFPWTVFLATGLPTMLRRLRVPQARPPLIFLLCWLAGVLIFIQPAHSKLASYIFPAIPAVAILIGVILDHSLTKAQPGRVPLKVPLFLTAAIFGLGSLAAIIAGHIYQDMLRFMLPVYSFAAALLTLSVLILYFVSGQKVERALASVGSMSLVIVFSLLMFRPFAVPWVSCKDVSTELKKLPPLPSPVVVSKFYVRAVRYFTDLEVAVIDINGKGFFSPHPIPFLNEDHATIAFLQQHAPLYCVLKENDVEDIKRLAGHAELEYQFIGGGAGKYIVRVE